MMWHNATTMPKLIDYTLAPDDLQAIERAIATDPQPRVRQRATGIRMLHLGKKPKEVAELLNVSTGTVYNWHGRWREDGLDGLADQPRSGRPKLATAAYVAELEKAIETEPSDLGYEFTIWTAERLLQHLEAKTGIGMSDDTLRAVLAEHDYVYRRPKHDLRPLQDAEARQRAEDLLNDLKKRPKAARSNYSLWTQSP